MGAHPHFMWKDLFPLGKSNPKKPIIEALRKTLPFKNLNRRELNYVSHLVYERIFQPEEAVFQQNDRGLGMYIILKGRVAIRSQGPKDEVLVTILEEGNFFGEMALVDPENLRTASAIALDRCVLLGFFKPDLLEMMQRQPAVAVKILFQLSSVLTLRLIETTHKLTRLLNAEEIPAVTYAKIA